jgi:bla regulator protein blaR1
MMLSWLLYATLVGALATLGAAALVRVLRALALPTRGAWIGAMLLTLALPLVAFLGRDGAAPLALGGSDALLRPAFAATWTITARQTSVPWASSALLGLWALATFVLLARLIGGIIRLRQHARDWPEQLVDGSRVKLSEHIGPAVAGFWTTEVIVPRWLLDVDASARALVLRHEEEHRQARDPLALAAASFACALAPWNAALWIQASRLRLAVEMDCDARVLRRTRDVHGYGMLLLDIAQRTSASTLTPAPALSEPASFLERRITAMTTKPSRHPFALVTLGALVVGAIALACSAPTPTNANTGPTPRSEPASGAAATSGQRYFEFKIEKPATIKPGQPSPRYPDDMRQKGIEGEVVAQFVVDTTGFIIPSTLKVVRATNDTFVAAVRNALPMLEFTPAEVDGRKVKQLLTMPFSFSLGK